MKSADVIDPRMLGELGAIHTQAMTAACAITRAGSAPPTLDPITLNLADPPDLDVYSGPCRVQPIPTRDRDLLVVGREVVTLRYNVFLPAGSPTVQRDDRLTVTAAVDPELVNRTLAVTDVKMSSLEVERALICVMEQ